MRKKSRGPSRLMREITGKKENNERTNILRSQAPRGKISVKRRELCKRKKTEKS